MKKRRADSNTDGKKSPARPTRCAPGTPGKIRILQKRAARGESLWHPLDAGMDREEVARVPVLSEGNYKITRWQIVDEKQWRANQPVDENDIFDDSE